MADLKLYTNPMSRGRIARWMLEEVGQPYDAVMVPYGPPMKDPAYLAINPMGKVPALTHGDVAITECAAICTYLADAFPAAGLSPPPGDPLRGPYLRWMFFGAGPVEAATTNASLGLIVPPERAGMVGYGSMDAVLDALEGCLQQGPFWLGERFSAVDVYLGSQIGWGLQFGSMPSRPAFVAYSERLKARPAAIKAAALDDAMMPTPPA